MAPESDYIYTRDYVDNNRINLGHYQWKDLFGYILHPAIPATDPHLSIADVATGTGIWLTDLSSQLSPTTRLDGLDVSFQAVPPVEWLPSNVGLRYFNIKEPVPEDLVGKYDVVHIRHLSLVLRDDEISNAVGNVAQMLSRARYHPPTLRDYSCSPSAEALNAVIFP